MNSLYRAVGGPPYAFRSAITTPEAVRTLYQIGAMPAQVTALMADQVEQVMGKRAAKACRNADLQGLDHEGPDHVWVKAQLAKRAAMYREKVLPLLEASGRTVRLADIARWVKDAELAAA